MIIAGVITMHYSSSAAFIDLLNSKMKMKCKYLESRWYFQDCQQTTQSLAQTFHQIVNDISGFETRFF